LAAILRANGFKKSLLRPPLYPYRRARIVYGSLTNRRASGPCFAEEPGFGWLVLPHFVVHAMLTSFI
jgi:hypothetical protein